MQKGRVFPSCSQLGALWHDLLTTDWYTSLASCQPDVFCLHASWLQITFVGIYGGSKGAAFERQELAKLGKLFEAREVISDINDTFIKSMACCL